ncbi:MAG TPA: DUF4258 domain-containing protein [Oculatellaceae cyanobacterium]
MEIRFYEDPQTGQPHIYNHQVSEEEVFQILLRPGEDRPAADDSRMALGQTDAGRYLRVIYVSDRDSIFVITAYELTDKQLKAYRRRRKKK